jgi:hypothetical protein
MPENKNKIQFPKTKLQINLNRQIKNSKPSFVWKKGHPNDQLWRNQNDNQLSVFARLRFGCCNLEFI